MGVWGSSGVAREEGRGLRERRGETGGARLLAAATMGGAAAPPLSFSVALFFFVLHRTEGGQRNKEGEEREEFLF